MWLDCGEHGRVPLGRITPSEVVAKECWDIPPCLAQLIVIVDGERLSSRVNLANGFTKGRRTALVLCVDNVAPF